MPNDDLKSVLECNRNIVISTDRGEYHDRVPMIVTVGYVEPPNVHRAVELDQIILPILRKALQKYIVRRLPTGSYKVQTIARFSHDGTVQTSTDVAIYTNPYQFTRTIEGAVDESAALLDFYEHPNRWERIDE